MATRFIPRPGPANLTPNAGLDEWLEEAKQCHYLPERVMKELCEMVKGILLEGKRCPLRRGHAMQYVAGVLTDKPLQNQTFSRFAPQLPSAATSTGSFTTCLSSSESRAACPARLPWRRPRH